MKTFIENMLVITGDKKDMISSSEMFTLFNNSIYYQKKDKSWFKEQMILHGLKPEKKTRRGIYYMNVVYFGVKPLVLGTE